LNYRRSDDAERRDPPCDRPENRQGLRYESIARELWEDFKEATFAAVRTTAMVLMVIGCAASFGWLLAYLKVPTAMVSLLQGISENPLVILLLLNIVLLILGTFMDMSPLIVITTPIFLPVATAFGVEPRRQHCPGRRDQSHLHPL
jgi:TRAP-type C4-dicarboxylate transport system permease large subunit